ncbi:hypothetical protein IFR35_26925 [Pseudomonas fluorescens]|uniref:hypothetical protein n=1 Tax=Pseudomonas fluorescens TaxID=294 RepID=UPI001781B37A|nr:hypothetical protein [Pseudomonas fluorescens]MBD8194709.1 hypothetical protein [Pseudomonas fluorescens]MBD8229469.1 hypothetical protein [Pseudomonas fluorescens]MBD8787840.1 hypothetical protein [Pseudomonas fluorescens]MBD8819884.1 hypothetical protein [Pseudomonas fluorescens]
MENPVPDLNIPINGASDQAQISLCAFTGPLVISIPSNARLFAEGTVYAILGADPENPDGVGAKISAGEWQEDTEQYQQLSNLKVEVPKKVLERFKNQTIPLRYQTIGESSIPFSSHPISLTINE